MNVTAELTGTRGHASATHLQPAVELESNTASAAAPDSKGLGSLHIRPLLNGVAAAMRSGWAASRRGLARRRQDHRRAMVDFERVEAAREEGLQMLYRNGGLR